MKFVISELLLAAVLGYAGASDVTMWSCKADDRGTAVRRYPVDYGATALNFQQCNVSTIDLGDFHGLPNLEIAYLWGNHITHVNTLAFRAIPKLKKLELNRNHLRNVPVFMEQTCPSLTVLKLNDNKLTGITNSETFSACKKLDSVALSNNRIDYLHPNIFDSLTELRSLYLGNNYLTFIPEQMFLKNSKLEQLSVDRNRLAYLPSHFLTSLGSRLNKFYFGENPWHCACLLELLSNVKEVGVQNYTRNPWTSIVSFDGTRLQCLYIGKYPCQRHVPSGMLPDTQRKH